MKTTVIVPCHNAESWLHKLIFTLSHEPCNIIAIENGSSDRTWEILRCYYKSVDSHAFEDDFGFAKANNIGAELAETPYLLFLNQDTEPEPGFIKAMEERMEEREETAIVGAKLIFTRTVVSHVVFQDRVIHLTRIKGRLDHAGIALNPNLLPYEVGRNRPPYLPQFNKARMYPAVTGACLMINRGVFEELGGFHEAFKNGWEDSDLCFRVWEAGHEVWYEPEAVVHHHHSTSEDRFTNEDANVTLWRERWHMDGRLAELAMKYEKLW